MILHDYTIQPAQISLLAGQAVRLSIQNAGAGPHSFAVDARGRTVATPILSPGGTASLEIPALPTGVYRTWCTVSGHVALGMTGTLAIGGATGTPQGPVPGSSGNMGPGMMNPSSGGMMGPGMMNPGSGGMMGPGMMNPSSGRMMGPGMMGPGMMGGTPLETSGSPNP